MPDTGEAAVKNLGQYLRLIASNFNPDLGNPILDGPLNVAEIGVFMQENRERTEAVARTVKELSRRVAVLEGQFGGGGNL